MTNSLDKAIDCRLYGVLTLKLEKTTEACESPSTRGAKKNSKSRLSFGFRASTSGPTSWVEPYDRSKVRASCSGLLMCTCTATACRTVADTSRLPMGGASDTSSLSEYHT